MNKKKARVLRKISKLNGAPYRKLKKQYVRVNEALQTQEAKKNS